MKKQVAQLMVSLMGVSIAPMVFAVPSPGTGTVTFNGELIEETCTINTDDIDKVVVLPTVSTQSLSNVADTAGSTMFSITASNCPASHTSIAAHFETTDMDPVTQNAINQATANPASNVLVQLLQSDGTTVLPLGSTGDFVNLTGSGSSRGATMNYGGQYYAVGQTTAGTVTAVVRYTLAYQ